MPAAATATKPRRTNGNKPSSNPVAGMPYDFDIVPIKHMMVDAYQRPLSSFVDEIEEDFNPALVGTVCLSKRSNSTYALIDGQTRIEAMRRLGIAVAPAVVYKNLTREQEAALFYLFQTKRRRMHSADIFKARVFAGEPEAVGVSRILEECGFHVDQNIASSGRTQNMGIAATGSLEYVYSGTFGRKGKKTEPNPELLRTTLEVIKRAFGPRVPDTAKSSMMIKGLGYFLAREPEPGQTWKKPRKAPLGPEQLDRLAVRLGKTTPSDLAKRAEALREGRGMGGNSPAYMAEAIEAQFRRTR